jgi:hypothetical protein
MAQANGQLPVTPTMSAAMSTGVSGMVAGVPHRPAELIHGRLGGV